MKLLRFLLFPFAILYGLVTSLRNAMFNAGLFKATSFSFPVIVIGNLSTGGTGKSPMTEYVIRLLKKQYTLAVLSRGYKRKTSGFLEVQAIHDAKDVGDEPLQFYKKFKDITVAVHEDRVAGIRQLEKTKQPEVVVLDDAFQHRKLKAGFYILLTPYDDLFLDDFLLPMGNLRELRVGARRADCIVVTKCPDHCGVAEQEALSKRIQQHFNVPVYFSSIRYASTLHGASNGLQVASLSEYTVLLVTGVANPKPLSEFLSSQQFDVIHLQYPDHHDFSSADLTKITKVFKGIPTANKLILTTEKDFMRLEGKLPQLQYLAIETVFMAQGDQFDEHLLDFCAR